MKILRKGARADHGLRSVKLDAPTMRWNATQDTFDLKFERAAADFATGSRHNYTLRFSPEEVASIVSQLADQALSMDAEEFAEIFGSSLPALIRLHLMASGVRLAA